MFEFIVFNYFGVHYRMKMNKIYIRNVSISERDMLDILRIHMFKPKNKGNF